MTSRKKRLDIARALLQQLIDLLPIIKEPLPVGTTKTEVLTAITQIKNAYDVLGDYITQDDSATAPAPSPSPSPSPPAPAPSPTPSPPPPSPAPPAPSPGPDETVAGTLLAAENATYTPTVDIIVAFRAIDDTNRVVTKTAPAGVPFTCNVAFFGSDPWDQHAKQCVSGGLPATAPISGTILGLEDETFTLAAPTLVAFRAIGAPEEVTANLPAGINTCSAATFGGIDPKPFTNKRCESRGPATTTPTAPTGITITDVNGAIDQAKYVAMAYAFGSEDGVRYRYGEPASSGSAPTLPQRADTGSINYYGNVRIYNQFGAEDNTKVNDFVSSHLAVAFRPETNKVASNSVGRLTAYQIDRRAVNTRPQLMWQSQQLLPPQVQDYINSTVLSNSEPGDLAIGEYRRVGEPDSGATRMSVVWTNGSPTRGARIYTVGTETAQNRASVILPVGLVVTDVSITEKGEFLFATIWNTVLFKGQVAVIALGGTPAGIDWTNPNRPWYDYWNEWTDMVHPGWANQGCWTFMKYLGTVDLPSNCKAPTSIHATTGMDPSEVIYKPDGNPGGIGYMASPLANNLDLMRGKYNKYIAHGGLLWVGSKTEGTLVTIDIRPLIKYFNDMYLGSAASNLETQNVGLNDSQWPYIFNNKPQMIPQVVKTIVIGKPIAGISSTVTRSYWSKDNTRRNPGTPYFMAAPEYFRARVITTDGFLYIYQAGRWVPGPYDPDIPAVASEISQIGTITGLGEQITHISAVKDFTVPYTTVYDVLDGPPGSLDELDMIVDRKNRAIKIIRYTEITGDGGTVIHTLRDSRMDPITADGVDSYYTTNKVIVVASYATKQILNYRLGPLVYPFQPANERVSNPTLDPTGEFCGGYTLPGFPIHAHTSNAP